MENETTFFYFKRELGMDKTRDDGGASGLNAGVRPDVLEAENRACAKHNAALIEENVKLRRDNERMRRLIERQYRADAALYAMPIDCTEDQHVAALKEHDAVHAMMANEVNTDFWMDYE